ncbi:MAG: hypothetical protein HYX50_04700 [Chloroflexi bacterium]|nr:hypothetical protein [Chloroflexota bacterium]
MARRDEGRSSQAPSYDEGAGALDRIRLGIGVGALVLLIAFLLSNLQRVEVRFLWMSVDTRMLFALLAAAGFGGIAAVVGGLFARRRER